MTNKIILPIEGFIKGPEEIKPLIRWVKCTDDYLPSVSGKITITLHAEREART